jgi:hypothetical protein
MGKKIETMTPDQIAAKGRELIRLARKKEAELHQHQLVCQSALKFDPPSASKNDPPQRLILV